MNTPNKGQTVLLFTEDFGYVVGIYDEVVNIEGNKEGQFLIHRSIESDDIVSVEPVEWMPLPTQKEAGHWIDRGSLSCRCDQCGCKSTNESRYCPNCGAKMEENK